MRTCLYKYSQQAGGEMMRPLRVLFVLATISAFFCAGIETSWAASESEGTAQDKEKSKDVLSEVVVTGTFSPISKADATTAIATIDSSQIELQNPINPFQILNSVPGVYVDS